MSTGATTPSGRPDLLWRMRWTMLACGVVTLAALIYLATTLSSGFEPTLLVWGIGIGAVVAAGVHLGATAGLRRMDPSSDPVAWLRHRRTIYTVVWLFLGVELGLLAGIIGSGLVIVAAAALVVVMLVVGALLLLIVRRKQRGG